MAIADCVGIGSSQTTRIFLALSFRSCHQSYGQQQQRQQLQPAVALKGSHIVRVGGSHAELWLMIMIGDYDWWLSLMITIYDYDWWLSSVIMMDHYAWWLWFMIMIYDHELWSQVHGLFSSRHRLLLSEKLRFSWEHANLFLMMYALFLGGQCCSRKQLLW